MMGRKAIIALVAGSVAVAFVVGLALLRSGTSRQPPINTSVGSRVGVFVGELAPAFALVDSSSQQAVTRETLRGKPALLWFTTTYCVPCQVGAKEVRKLDTDLGGQAFEVVMVFIDPSESDADLADWEVNFGNADWVTAKGGDQITNDYRIRYLDTQYLLDATGVIRNVAYGPVGYERYQALLQALVGS